MSILEAIHHQVLTVCARMPQNFYFAIMAFTSSTFTSGFEAGFSGWEKELCCNYSAEIVSSPKLEGNHAAKFTLKESDPKRRAELKLKPVPANSEWTYRFSTFLPANYATDRSYEIIAQWHEKPDFNLGETWRRPPLSLSIKDNKFRVSNRWDPKPVSVSYKEAGSQGWNLGAVAKEKWTDWMFHVKWSYKSDGLIEIWKNGKLVIKKTGPNTYNDRIGPYFKIGIYKPQWKAAPQSSNTTQRVIYFDQVRVDKGS